MSDAASRIATDIDFDRQGRQSGYLRAPLSRNTSGWGIVEIPIVVINNGTGPTVLFTGGVHGDEYEGPIAVSELARTLDPARVQGRIIMMPAVNIPAVLNDTRLSPVDNRDMNRCFPGNAKGTFSEMLAHYLDAVILPMVEAAGIDLLWFGIYVVLVVEMSQITPPVGFNLFVIQGLTGRDILYIARAALPFFLLMCVAVVILVAFPDLVTWLPELATRRS